MSEIYDLGDIVRVKHLVTRPLGRVIARAFDQPMRYDVEALAPANSTPIIYPNITPDNLELHRLFK